VGKLFFNLANCDNENSVKRAARGKTLHSPLSDNSPHIGHWTKVSMGIKSWIFFKNGKPAFKKLTPLQNGRIIDIGCTTCPVFFSEVN
jgi:hypothetical protein